MVVISMRFSDWLTLDQIDSEAPPEPGLFQVKVREGLVTYPRGKSAMFYYGYANDLRKGLDYFRTTVLQKLEIGEDAVLCRCMPAVNHETRFQNHLNTFFNNFGALPKGNQSLLRKSPPNLSSCS